MTGVLIIRVMFTLDICFFILLLLQCFHLFFLHRLRISLRSNTLWLAMVRLSWSENTMELNYAKERIRSFRNCTRVGGADRNHLSASVSLSLAHRSSDLWGSVSALPSHSTSVSPSICHSFLLWATIKRLLLYRWLSAFLILHIVLPPTFSTRQLQLNYSRLYMVCEISIRNDIISSLELGSEINLMVHSFF